MLIVWSPNSNLWRHANLTEFRVTGIYFGGGGLVCSMRRNNQNTKTATQTMDAIVPRGIPKTTGRIPSESGRPYNSTSHAPIPRAIMPMTNFETTFIVEMIHIDVA